MVKIALPTACSSYTAVLVRLFLWTCHFAQIISGMPCRCGNVAAILELDEHLTRNFKVRRFSTFVVHMLQACLGSMLVTNPMQAVHQEQTAFHLRSHILAGCISSGTTDLHHVHNLALCG